MRNAPAVLFPLFLLGAALAQTPVTVRCTPTDGSAAGCYYCPGYQNVIKWVGTRLQSSTINLVQYHDLDVRLQGTWNGTVIDVTSVQIVGESFSISGNAHIGTQVDYTTAGADGDIALNFAALGNGFAVPIGDVALQLDPLRMAPLDAGVISSGEYQSTLSIPNVPSLVGLRIYGQGVVLTQSLGLYSTNVDTKVVN